MKSITHLGKQFIRAWAFIVVISLNVVDAYSQEHKEIMPNETVEYRSVAEAILAATTYLKEYAETFFVNSTLIIIPDQRGEIYMARGRDFFPNSTKFFDQNRPIDLKEIKSGILRITKGDIKQAYYLLIIAQEDIPYKYVQKVVSLYQDSLSELFEDEFDLMQFHLILVDSFGKLDELYGWGNSDKK